MTSYTAASTAVHVEKIVSKVSPRKYKLNPFNNVMI